MRRTRLRTVRQRRKVGVEMRCRVSPGNCSHLLEQLQQRSLKLEDIKARLMNIYILIYSCLLTNMAPLLKHPGFVWPDQMVPVTPVATDVGASSCVSCNEQMCQWEPWLAQPVHESGDCGKFLVCRLYSTHEKLVLWSSKLLDWMGHTPDFPPKEWFCF